MALQKELVRARLAPALARKEFRLGTLNGAVPLPMHEALELGRVFSKGRFREFQDRLVDGPGIGAGLNNAIADAIRNKRLHGGTLFMAIQSAFIRNGVYVDHRFGDNPGMIIGEIDMENFLLYSTLGDSTGNMQNGGRICYEDCKGYMTVNITTAAGRAGAFLSDWLDAREDVGVDERWHGLDGDPRLVLADVCLRSVIGRIKMMSWNAETTESLALELVEMLARSSAIHETAHLAERRAGGMVKDHDVLERMAYCLQAMHSHPGVALLHAEQRGVLHVLFPELIKEVRALGKAALETGCYRYREILASLLEADFRKYYGKPHERVVDVSLFDYVKSRKMFYDDDKELVMAALHSPD